MVNKLRLSENIDKKRYFNVEISRTEFEKLRKFLKQNRISYEASGSYHEVHVEIYCTDSDMGRIDNFISQIEESYHKSRRIGRRNVTEARGRKSCTQASLKRMIQNGEARDVSDLSEREYDDLLNSSRTVLCVGNGINGMNCALIQNDKTGELFAITARNTDLFRFV